MMMTYQDIYDRFMIEYDKANVTSSYPSLTIYEACVILDKAYLALIGQKLTGNNLRGSHFEQDIKVTEDLRPLIVTKTITNTTLNNLNNTISNAFSFKLPEEMLYYILGYALIKLNNVIKKSLPIVTISHQIASRFLQSSVNMPWIKNPVCYFENNIATLLYDKWELNEIQNGASAECKILPLITYIKQPVGFVNWFTNKSQGTELHQGETTPTGEENTNQYPYTISYAYGNVTYNNGFPYLYDTSNSSTITKVCTSEKGSSTITVNVIEGQLYINIVNDTITVLNTASNKFEKVVIDFICDDDRDYSVRSELYVKYYTQNTETPVNTEEVKWTAYFTDLDNNDIYYNENNCFSAVVSASKGQTQLRVLAPEILIGRDYISVQNSGQIDGKDVYSVNVLSSAINSYKKIQLRFTVTVDGQQYVATLTCFVMYYSGIVESPYNPKVYLLIGNLIADTNTFPFYITCADLDPNKYYGFNLVCRDINLNLTYSGEIVHIDESHYSGTIDLRNDDYEMYAVLYETNLYNNPIQTIAQSLSVQINIESSQNINDRIHPLGEFELDTDKIS